MDRGYTEIEMPRPSSRPISRRGRRQSHVVLSFVLLFVCAVVVCAAVWYLVTHHQALLSLGGFLFAPTGWDISLSFLPYSGNDPYWWAFLVGLTNTIMAGLFGIVGATLIGFVLGAAPLAGNKLLTGLANIYSDVFRNIPLILQAMFWYG